MPALGGIEIAIGLAVAAVPRITLLVLARHLTSTFLTIVTASELMWGGQADDADVRR